MLRCLASGDPEPTITWLKDRASLLGKDPRMALLDHGSLQIQDTQVRRQDCTALGQSQYRTGTVPLPHWARISTPLDWYQYPTYQYHTGAVPVADWACYI